MLELLIFVISYLVDLGMVLLILEKVSHTESHTVSLPYPKIKKASFRRLPTKGSAVVAD
jgi:hypothetical protein